MADKETKRVAAYLLKNSFVTEEQLRQCLARLEESGQSVSAVSLLDFLVAEGMITRRQAETVASNTAKRAGPKRRAVRIEGYGLAERIGQGSTGAVFKARQTALDREVALKILSPRLAKNEVFVARFTREGRSASKLAHPNVVRIVDAGESDGLYYLAMEYVDGQSAKQLLKSEGRLPAEEVLKVGRQMADALAHAESLGLVHRDVKPANILLTTEGVAKLADFGLAREADDTSVTQAGAGVIGTPLYISPEQARGSRELDTRTDLYSLGATLYHLATGSAPFAGETSAAIMAKHIREDPTPPHEREPSLPHPLSRVIMKMMAKDPKDRYQTAAELRGELDALLSSAPAAGADDGRESPGPATPGVSGRRKGVLAAAAIAALLLVGLAAYLLSDGDSTEAPAGGRDDRATTDGREAGVAAESPSPRSAPATPPQLPGWTNLFDGRSLDSWSTFLGKWSVEGGEILVQSEIPACIYTGDLAWKNYLFHAKFKLEEGSRVGIIVLLGEQPEQVHHVREGDMDLHNCYRVEFSKDGKARSICRTGCHVRRSRTSRALDCSPNQWHQVLCDVSETGVKVRLDGQEVPFPHPDTFSRLSGGRVGVFCREYTTARFKDVRIKHSDPSPKPSPSATSVAEASSTKPSPASDRPDAAADRRKLPESWRALQQSVAKAPEQYVEHLRGYELFEQQAQGTQYQLMARDAIDQMRRALSQKAEAARKRLSQEAEVLIEKHEFAKALAVWSRFPKNLLSDEWAAKLDKAKQDVRAKALAAFESERRAAAALAAQGRFAEAEERLAATRAYGLEVVSQRAAKAMADLAERREEEAADRRHAVAAKYREVLTRAREQARKYDFEAAQRLLREAQDDETFALLAKQIQQDRGDLEMVEQVWQRAQEGAELLKGERFTVRGIRGRVEKVADGKIHVRSGGVLVAQPIERLKPAELVALASRKLDLEDPQSHLQLANFWFAIGETDRAAEELKIAAQSGLDVARYDRMLRYARLGPLECEAEDLYALALAAYEANNKARAGRLFARLMKDYADTKLYATRSGTIERLRTDDGSLSPAQLAMFQLFRGRCAFLADGRVKLSYDFSEEEQLRDWTMGSGYRIGCGSHAPGSWAIDAGALQCRTHRAPIAFNAPFVGDLTAELLAKDCYSIQVALLASENMAGSKSGYQFSWSYGRHIAPAHRRIYTFVAVGQEELLREESPSPDFAWDDPFSLSAAYAKGKLAFLVAGEVLHERALASQRFREGYFHMRASVGSYFSDLHLTGTVDPGWLATQLASQRAVTELPPEQVNWVSLFDGQSLDNWRSHGQWTVQDGEIVGESRDRYGLLLRAGDEGWRNYVFEAKFKLERGDECGLLVRSRVWPDATWPHADGSILSGHRVTFAILGAVQPGCVIDRTLKRRHERRAVFAPGLGKWHHVVWAAQDDGLRMQIDGKKVRVDFGVDLDDRAKLARGAIALFCGPDSRVRFKDVRVQVSSTYKGADPPLPSQAVRITPPSAVASVPPVRPAPKTPSPGPRIGPTVATPAETPPERPRDLDELEREWLGSEAPSQRATALFDGTSIKGWTVSGGRWSVEGGEIVATCSQPACLYIGDENWQDYLLVAKMKLESGPLAGVMARVRRETAEYRSRGEGLYAISNCYYLGIHSAGRVMVCSRAMCRAGPAARVARTIDRVYGKWRLIAVRVVGEEVALQIDGTDMPFKLFRTRDWYDRLSHGCVGLFCFGGTRARFKDIKIKVLKSRGRE